MWVKVPYISKDTDTTINLSYSLTNDDNSHNIGYTGSAQAKEVWTEYNAVYHLSKDGANSTVYSAGGVLNNIDSSNIVDFGIGETIEGALMSARIVVFCSAVLIVLAGWWVLQL